MSKPQPVFEEMPPHVKKMILNNLDLETKLNCRLVNKKLKSVVESTEITIHKVQLKQKEDGTIYLTFPPKECNFANFSTEYRMTEEVDDLLVHYALIDFRAILGTFRKVTIETFILNLEGSNDLLKTFESEFQENELNVKNLQIKGQRRDLTETIKRFQPGTLKFLRLSTYLLEVSNIMKLDAFKQLWSFELISAICTGVLVSPNDIKHLKYCSICELTGMTVEDAVFLRNECMKKPDGETLIYASGIDEAAFFKAFGPYNQPAEWRYQNGESVFKLIHTR